MPERNTGSRIRRVVLWVLAIALLFVGGAYLAIRLYLPGLVRERSQAVIRQTFGDQASLEDATVSLIGTSITLKGFSLAAPRNFSEPTIFSFESLVIDFGSLRRVAEGELVIDDVTVKRPRVVVETQQGGRLNTAEVAAHMSGQDRGDGLLPFDISRIQLQEGEMVWRDERVSPPLTTSLTGLTMNIEGLRSPMPSSEMGTVITMSARGPGDAPVNAEMAGNFFQPNNAMSFDVAVDATDVDVTHFEPYFSPTSPLVIEEGLVDADLTGTCRSGRLDLTIVLQMHDFETRVRRGDGIRDRVVGVTPRLAAAFFGSELLDDPITVRIEGDLNDPQFDLTDEMNARIARALADRITGLAESGLLVVGDIVETGVNIGGAVVDAGVNAVGAGVHIGEAAVGTGVSAVERVGGFIGDAVDRVPLPSIGDDEEN